jgi:hypothetical protein
MAFLAQFAARGARSAVALATAIALLLPLPVRCAACSTGSDRCPCCSAYGGEFLGSTELIAVRDSHGEALAQTRTCCQSHVATDAAPTAAATKSLHPSHHACGCSARPAPRTTRPVEKLHVSPETLAGLADGFQLPFSLQADVASTPIIHVAASPPIPHRILHCSWII